MLSSRKAQAATELAVLGALIFIAFYFLINYSERLNRQQSYIMQTFRSALKEARKANDAATYTKVVFRRMPNVSQPMELGQLQTFSSSASVFWAKGEKMDEYGYVEEKKGVNKYQLNEDAAIDLPSREDADQPAAGMTETSTTTFTNKISSVNDFGKREAVGGIVTAKQLKAADTQEAKVTIDNKEYTFKHNLGEGGKYYPDQASLTRSRSMQ